MKKPDVILVAGLELTEQKIVLHQYGQSILKQILEKRYAVEQVNFDRMVSLGEFRYEGDYDGDLDRMADLLAARGSGIIGFYTICNNFINVAALALRVHEKAPGAKLFFGGPHATMTWEHCLTAFPFLSAVCMGESEHSILPLVDAAATMDDDGSVTVFAVNRGLTEDLSLQGDLRAFGNLRIAEHIVLHHDDVKAVNTEDHPDEVKPTRARGGRMDGGRLSVRLPALSWNVIRLTKE